MWLMKSPPDMPTTGATGRAFGQDLKNGYVLCTKQYEMKMLKDRKFTDETPEEMKSIDPLNPKKVIVIRWGGYGDILMCLPALSLLKEKYPNLVIVMAGMDKHAQVLKEHPLIDAILLPPAHQIGNLIEEYDMAYDLSGIIPSNPDSDYINAYDLHLQWFGFNPEEIDASRKILDFVVTSSEEIEISNILKAVNINDDDFIIYFNAMSSTELRNLPFDKAREAINLIANKYPNYKIIVPTLRDAIQYKSRFMCNKCKTVQFKAVAGKFDKPVNVICEKCGAEIKLVPFDYTGKLKGKEQRIIWHTIAPNVYFPELTFRQACALIYKSSLVISVDSAPIHIAGFLEIPTIGIFSSFDGDLRMRYFKNSTWIQSDFRCAPCFMHNTPCAKLRTEKRLFSPCMDAIEPRLILQKANEIINKIGEAEIDKYGEFTLDIKKPEPFVLPSNEGINCFACGHTEATRSFRKGKQVYWICKACGSLYIYPKPTLTYLKENYQDPDYNIIFKDMQGITKVAQTITTTLAQKFNFKGKMLEIGANIGWFGQEAVRLGWDYTGVEISKYSVAECRKKGLKGKVILGSIEDGEVFQQVQDKNPEGYDVFIIHNTLEHCINPVSLLTTLGTLAKPGSIFSISQPCVDFWDGRNTWQHINPFFAGEHINLPTKQGMQELARRIGCTISHVEDFAHCGEAWHILEKV